jgi:hypothetical protein
VSLSAHSLITVSLGEIVSLSERCIAVESLGSMRMYLSVHCFASSSADSKSLGTAVADVGLVSS